MGVWWGFFTAGGLFALAGDLFRKRPGRLIYHGSRSFRMPILQTLSVGEEIVRFMFAEPDDGHHCISEHDITRSSPAAIVLIVFGWYRMFSGSPGYRRDARHVVGFDNTLPFSGCRGLVEGVSAARSPRRVAPQFSKRCDLAVSRECDRR